MKAKGPLDAWSIPFDEPPAVSRWKGIGYLLFSIPFWILAVVIGLALKS